MITVAAPVDSKLEHIISDEALTFIEQLHHNFAHERERLLKRRIRVQQRINAGILPTFLPETKSIREKKWEVAPAPKDLQKRWVEITGPASNAKMVINALNSGANVYMADAEDSESPMWNNLLHGQLNLFEAVRKKITHADKAKTYALNDSVATLMFRPRGWHLEEKHVLVDDQPVSASLFDFGLFVFNNARELLNRGSGPNFYWPKIESRYEARLCNNMFNFSEQYFQLPSGSISVTPLIETIPAGFEMNEILYELRKRSVALNCGRWDYIFSFIKKFQNYPGFVLPDRSQVTMDKAFLDAYVRLLIQTCHKRGAHAIGGMSAYIPVKDNPEANERALDKVRKDKIREVHAGHDGTWVAHPGLVQIARDIFELHLNGADHQMHVMREKDVINDRDLLMIPAGTITEEGLRANISIGIQYLGAWLAGNGCVPLNNLMEDAATAEISRSQVWQWLRHGAQLADSRKVTEQMVYTLIDETMTNLKSRIEPSIFETAYVPAQELFAAMISNPKEKFENFLTLPAYEHLLKQENLVTQ